LSGQAIRLVIRVVVKWRNVFDFDSIAEGGEIPGAGGDPRFRTLGPLRSPISETGSIG
jgi:hypothetical protein